MHRVLTLIGGAIVGLPLVATAQTTTQPTPTSPEQTTQHRMMRMHHAASGPAVLFRQGGTMLEVRCAPDDSTDDCVNSAKTFLTDLGMLTATDQDGKQ